MSPVITAPRAFPAGPDPDTLDPPGTTRPGRNIAPSVPPVEPEVILELLSRKILLMFFNRFHTRSS